MDKEFKGPVVKSSRFIIKPPPLVNIPRERTPEEQRRIDEMRAAFKSIPPDVLKSLWKELNGE